MSDYNTPFEQRPDSGRLLASKSKANERSPDYFGELAINIEDMTAAKVEDGFVIFKLNGWKKKSKAGVTFLSLSVNRFVPDGTSPPPKKSNYNEEDFPF
jgi:hypothetical protein